MSITLITPVFNSADTLEDCMLSVARQSEPCQHILIDGGSTDLSLGVIKENANENVEWISEPDLGMYDAINKGIARANGDIVGVLNSDDFYPTNSVLRQVTEVFGDTNVDACYGDLIYVDRRDIKKISRNWKSGIYKKQRFYNGWMPPHPTFFIRKQHYEQYGGYRLDLGSAADYELMLRMLLKHDLNPAYIHEVLVHMRTEGMSNATLKNRIRANRMDREAWRTNSLTPRPWTLIAKPLGKVGQWLNAKKLSH